MPNWCENELEIYGKRYNLKKCKNSAKGENGILDMNSFIPYPVQFRNQDKIQEIFLKRL